jgi:hypothetical protein
VGSITTPRACLAMMESPSTLPIENPTQIRPKKMGENGCPQISHQRMVRRGISTSRVEEERR